MLVLARNNSKHFFNSTDTEEEILMVAVVNYGLYGINPDIEAGTELFKCFEEIKTDIDKQKKKKGAK